MRFIDQRLRELARHLDRHGALAPLATPTHSHGWLDAHTLVRRLAVYEQENRRPLRHDLLQALLRLAPDGRAERWAWPGTAWRPGLRRCAGRSAARLTPQRQGRRRQRCGSRQGAPAALAATSAWRWNHSD
ncbi:MAG: hypothetical protein IPN78_12730 [Candidatus Accumulibacter sp.]|nr:hypothetical protein [Candidatus Accumulibacter propinquus]